MRVNSFEDESLTRSVIGAAIEVHKHLGPGLLESAYEACLGRELEYRGLRFDRQVPLPLVYRGMQVDCAYRLDLLVENELIVEVKAVKELSGLHEAQVISYLKMLGKQKGLLINFNVQLLKLGLRRLEVVASTVN